MTEKDANENEFLKKIRKIEINSRKLVQKDLIGAYKSAFKGMGMQFSEFRQYVYGDDVRHIAWNVSARSKDPVLKVYEEERERSLVLLVDVSASLRKGIWAKQKAERLAEIAATLALSASLAQDNLGLILFSDQVEKVIPPAKGKTHLLRIIRDVLAFKPKSRGSDPDIALQQLNRSLKKKAIVFLLSDFHVVPSSTALKHCSLKHELIAINVSQKEESEIPAVKFLEIENAEDDRPLTLDTQSYELRKKLKQYNKDSFTKLENELSKGGVKLLSIETNEDFIAPLKSFFLRGR